MKWFKFEFHSAVIECTIDCRNFARVVSGFVLVTGCSFEFPEMSFQKYCARWFLFKFSFRIFDRIAEIVRSSAAFRFLILIISWISVIISMLNFACLRWRLPTRFLSLPAERWLRSTAAAKTPTRQHRLECECESAVIPAAPLPPQHAGSCRGRLPPPLLGPPSACTQAEQAERLARGAQREMHWRI